MGPRIDIAAVVSQVLLRLLLAAFLGGLIGLEREVKHKPAGVRTQMFICFGSAFFTILSSELASGWGGDHTRIAAQIIPGIGFIGAGSILHSRGSVTGLTTAATLFVVASIGMAAGGGLYLPALFATLVILVALRVLGWLEARYKLKPLVMAYDVVGAEVEETLKLLNAILGEEQRFMQTVQVSRADHAARVQFTVEASPREQEALLRRIQQTPAFQRVESTDSAERE